jgi:hypothetical protein
VRFTRYLRIARQIGWAYPQPKAHVVVCAAFKGKKLLAVRTNTASEHAEARAIEAAPDADRLVVFRFNRADPERRARESCPCSKCCPIIRASKVRRVEYLSPLGPVVVKVKELEPYNGK